MNAEKKALLYIIPNLIKFVLSEIGMLWSELCHIKILQRRIVYINSRDVHHSKRKQFDTCLV